MKRRTNIFANQIVLAAEATTVFKMTDRETQDLSPMYQDHSCNTRWFFAKRRVPGLTACINCMRTPKHRYRSLIEHHPRYRAADIGAQQGAVRNPVFASRWQRGIAGTIADSGCTSLLRMPDQVKKHLPTPITKTISPASQNRKPPRTPAGMTNDR